MMNAVSRAEREQQAIATDQFVGERDGKPVVVLKGMSFPATDPLVKAYPDKFEHPSSSSRGKSPSK